MQSWEHGVGRLKFDFHTGLELTSCLVGVCVEIKLQAPHAIGTMLSLSDHCVSLTG